MINLHNWKTNLKTQYSSLTKNSINGAGSGCNGEVPARETCALCWSTLPQLCSQYQLPAAVYAGVQQVGNSCPPQRYEETSRGVFALGFQRTQVFPHVGTGELMGGLCLPVVCTSRSSTTFIYWMMMNLHLPRSLRGRTGNKG